VAASRSATHREVWARGANEAAERDFATHVQAIAHGRYVLRHILRLLDEEAIAAGLQPLLHQTLLQIYGASEPPSISQLADRMGLASALMSRLIRRLETDDLVERLRSSRGDRRVVTVRVRPKGVEILRQVDHRVHESVDAFQRGLDEESKLGALATFASYLGLDRDPRLRDLLGDVDVSHSVVDEVG
jgi:DNA-binding MarR family transcriptional regulator